MTETNRRGRRGRKGGGEDSRRLVALLSALEHEGDTLTVSGVAARLGVDEGRARRLMHMLVEVAATEGSYVALASDDEGESLTLAWDGGTRGRRVRLTPAETFALLAALDQAGVPEDDPVRRQVEQSTAADGVRAVEVERRSAPGGSVGVSRTIGSCVRAILDHRALLFPYQGANDEGRHERHVVPQALRQRDGLWYLDAWDLDRAGARVFRLDRMGVAHDAGPAPAEDGGGPAGMGETHEGRAGGGSSAPRVVTLTFDSDEPVKLFDWHETERTALPDGRVRIRTPYLGGDWLARHVAACGAHVACDDAWLADAARAWAAATLREAGEDASEPR